MKRSNLHHAVLGAALALSLGFSFSSQAATDGWKQENGNWVYIQNGSRVTNEWKKTTNYWFYLGSDGYMVTNSIVDNKYVNEDGAMVSNSWRKVYSDGEENWYYFTNTGTMAEDGWKTINNKKYHFDSDGTMDHGWFDDNQYYLGSEDDGAMRTGWATISGPAGSTHEQEEGYYYFSTNGQITKDKIGRKINGYSYAFDPDGRMLYGWVDVTNKVMAGDDGASSDIRDYQYYKDEKLTSGIDGSRITGWKRMDPPDTIYSTSEDTPWFYFKDGVPYAASGQNEYTIKTIRSKKYCFNESGEMLTGFQNLTNTGSNAGSSSNASSDDGTDLYYFGAQNDGSMKTGSMTLYREDDGEKHAYFFATDGKGVTGLKSESLYYKGKRLDADRDLKYQVVGVGNVIRLVNTSGKIQKSGSGKAKTYTDSDGRTFTVDARGEITSEIPSGYQVKTE